MSKVYYGRSAPNAYQAIAHDLGGMRTLLRLAIGANDKAVRDRYMRDVALREQDFTNLADHPIPQGWKNAILGRTNDLLYEIHLLVQLPLWQYVIKDYPQVGVVTAVRTSKRVN